jgi:hypothetical protein
MTHNICDVTLDVKNHGGYGNNGVKWWMMLNMTDNELGIWWMLRVHFI